MTRAFSATQTMASDEKSCHASAISSAGSAIRITGSAWLVETTLMERPVSIGPTNDANHSGAREDDRLPLLVRGTCIVSLPSCIRRMRTCRRSLRTKGNRSDKASSRCLLYTSDAADDLLCVD